MSATANALLLAAAALYFTAGYRLSWTASTEPGALPPVLAACHPRLRRLYRLSMFLAFFSCTVMVAHLAVHTLSDTGPLGSEIGVAAGLLLLTAALGCVAFSRPPR